MQKIAWLYLTIQRRNERGYENCTRKSVQVVLRIFERKIILRKEGLPPLRQGSILINMVKMK